MLGIGAIEILDASYCLGMCGRIVFRINKTGETISVTHSMSEGLIVSRLAGQSPRE